MPSCQVCSKQILNLQKLTFALICRNCKNLDFQILNLLQCKTKNNLIYTIKNKLVDVLQVFIFLVQYQKTYIKYLNSKTFFIFIKNVFYSIIKQNLNEEIIPLSSDIPPKIIHMHIQWILLHIYKHVDFTQYFVENINNHFIATLILRQPVRINWYKTFYGGQTILEIVHAKCLYCDVVEKVNEKYPYHMIEDILQNLKRSQCELNIKPPKPKRNAPKIPVNIQPFILVNKKIKPTAPPPPYESLYY